MDLQVFFRVLGRFRLLVAAGFLVAVVLAVLSFAKVDFSSGTPKFSYRSHELWESNSRLLLTQPGFKWGTNNPGPDAADIEGRLPGLAAIYSSFVTSDEVMRIMRKNGPPITGTVMASALPAGSDGRGTLPVVNILAIDTTVLNAIQLANRAAQALQTYVREQQDKNGTAPANRIELQPLNVAFAPQLIQPRSKTMPIVVFLAIMFCTLSIAFLLENVRPRPRAVVVEPESAPLARMPLPEHETAVARDRQHHLA